ncbi:fibrinogen C domain-containing protein 1-like [Anopheles albimanus]|uniref:fibrinogen C domain-containing protein 1-like n=1 Tax=Anopheles albimanus TaxID=7167 RepID=UPI00163EF4F3|nr:fibrinogen C domain-containing protein 1-like [Anopheles albimanus]
MKLFIYFLLICAALGVRATENAPPAPTGEITGFWLEIMMTKLSYIDRKLLKLQSDLDQHRERMERNQECHQNTSPSAPTATTTTPNPRLPYYSSCKNVPSKLSGVYLISVHNDSAPFNVYCEQEKFGGGWIVIQHRFDGSVDFYRNWEQYRDGFGELDSEFWLGLEHIHQLTTARTHELIVEVTDFSGNSGHAHYNAFQVGSESEMYELKTLGTYNGTAGDSLSYYEKGRKFSTKDRNNDGRPEYHFAVRYEGAWWYGSGGGYSNLNGRYQNAANPKSNWWWYFKTPNWYHGLSFTRMMIREL